mmetsp:Transcript_48024/g.121190  ORF Transcript_48024/g.121190 Transcript_48024/m.121190 type:complete len:1103 (-) Transcript_48024:202-3510(-)
MHAVVRGERGVDQVLHLLLVDREGGGGGGGGGGAPHVLHHARLAPARQRAHFQLPADGLEPGLHVLPGAHVLRLLLAPDDLGVSVLPDAARDQVVRERCDLLQTDEHNVADAPAPARLRQLVVEGAAAEDDAADGVGRQEEGRAVGAGALVARVVGGLAVVDEAVEEGAGGEVVQGGGAGAVVEQELVAQQHQRLAEGAVHLPAQDVEELRGGGGVDEEEVGVALRVAPHVLHHERLPLLEGDVLPRRQPQLPPHGVADLVQLRRLELLLLVQAPQQLPHLFKRHLPRFPVCAQRIKGGPDLLPVGGGVAGQVVGVVVGELQEALYARAAVVGPHALKPVRQRQHQPALLPPFGLPRRDELVHHHLRVVHKVAKLRLPDGERGVRAAHREAVLEAQRRVLVQRRVVHLDVLLGEGVGDVVQRRVLRARHLVVQHHVPVVEGAALHVLPRQPDRVGAHVEPPHGLLRAGVLNHLRHVRSVPRGGVPLVPRAQLPRHLVAQQAAKRERLRHAHVHARGGRLHHAAPRAHQLGDGGVRREALRQPRQLAAHPLQRLHRQPRRLLLLRHHLCATLFHGFRRAECGHQRRALPGAGQELVRRLVVHARSVRVVLRLVAAAQLRQPGVNLRGRHQTGVLQPLRVEPGHRQVLADELAGERRRRLRVVQLVVSIPPITGARHHDVLLVPRAPVCRQLAGAHHRLRVVRVGVQHRNAQALGHVGAVHGGAPVRGGGGKPNLVVDDQVYGAADVGALQFALLQPLSHHAEPGEGGVPVEDDCRVFVNTGGPGALLHCPHDAGNDSVDGLQVAGVGRHAHANLHALHRVHHLPFRAEVVLHVAHGEAALAALHLRADLPQRLAEHVVQHIEAAAVRHADLDAPHAVGPQPRHSNLQPRDQRLAALHPKALGRGELLPEEGLHGVGAQKALQQVAPHGVGQLAPHLQLMDEEHPLVRLHDVPDLRREGVAPRRRHVLHRLNQTGALPLLRPRQRDELVHRQHGDLRRLLVQMQPVRQELVLHRVALAVRIVRAEGGQLRRRERLPAAPAPLLEVRPPEGVQLGEEVAVLAQVAHQVGHLELVPRHSGRRPQGGSACSCRTGLEQRAPRRYSGA